MSCVKRQFTFKRHAQNPANYVRHLLSFFFQEIFVVEDSGDNFRGRGKYRWNFKVMPELEVCQNSRKDMSCVPGGS